MSVEINSGPPFLRISLGAGSGWIIGQVSGSCTASCENVGMFCHNSDLKKHNSEVSTSPKVAKLITKLGGSLKNTTCDPAFGTAADTPNFSVTGGWCVSSSGDKAKVYDCEVSPYPNSQNKARLCYCTTTQGRPKSTPLIMGAVVAIGLAMNSIFLVPFLKKTWFAWRQINDPSLGKHYSLKFIPSTPSAPSRTLERLFELT